jgi:hypothetical protein
VGTVFAMAIDLLSVPEFSLVPISNELYNAAYISTEIRG